MIMHLVDDSNGLIDWAASRAELDKLEREEQEWKTKVDAAYQEVIPEVEEYYQARIGEFPYYRIMPYHYRAESVAYKMGGPFDGHAIRRIRLYLASKY